MEIKNRIREFRLMYLVVCGLVLSWTTLAQVADQGYPRSDHDPFIASPFLEEEISKSAINQSGFSNEVKMVQIQGGNVAKVGQMGTNNFAFLRQNGFNNYSVAEQEGRGNDYRLDIYGNDNQTNVFQRGDRNSIVQELEGNGMNYVVTQEGYGNEVTQVEDGSINPAYEIRQQGNGMRLTIEQGNIGF